MSTHIATNETEPTAPTRAIARREVSLFKWKRSFRPLTFEARFLVDLFTVSEFTNEVLADELQARRILQIAAIRSTVKAEKEKKL